MAFVDNCTRLILLFCITVAFAARNVKFTNLQCKSFDTNFSTFEKCNLKMIRRGVVGLNCTVNLHQIPVTNISINISFFKKSNGYNSFLYNSTGDFCKFLKNREKFPIFKILADYLLRESNVNHTCPYDHDIIVTNLVLDKNMFNLLPLASGEYMFRLMVAAYNDWKAEVKFFFNILD